ncbi:F-box only protein 28-like [Daphnia carinata]|uniref:F-box only protein 28-like n=1 Tax=Daphnia carinata TaxID=120202 RepID=UPI00257A2796|nr:F-box only protein 28-like [Daphnia carinata]
MTDLALDIGDKISMNMGKQAINVQVHGPSNDDHEEKVTILSLNDDVFQEILSHLPYDEIAKLRLVSRHFNEVCQKILNKGFLAVQRYHNRCLKEMKAKLPRRESERRTHPLARHIDVLTGIETRLSLLSMTYYKYTVLGVFCFIPGKVLDECYRVLREVVVHKNPPKSYELLQELRDISSMAMEHFEEHIVPTMKRNQMINTAIRNNSPRFIRCLADADDSDSESNLPSPSSAASCTPLASKTLNNFVRASFTSPNTNQSSLSSNLKIELAVQQNRMTINSQKKQIMDLRTKLFDYGRKIAEQDRLLSEYSRKLIQLEKKISSNETDGDRVPSVVTPPPSGRKRPAEEDEETVVEEPPIVKRNILKTVKGQKSVVSSFSMSLRSRKSLQ